MSDSIETEYVRATEYNLATVEEMAMLKSTSASRLRRQRNICHKMLSVCAAISMSNKIIWTRPSNGRQFGRVRRLLDGGTENLMESLDLFINDAKDP